MDFSGAPAAAAAAALSAPLSLLVALVCALLPLSRRSETSQSEHKQSLLEAFCLCLAPARRLDVPLNACAAAAAAAAALLKL